MTETIFTNGRIVTADADFDGTVVVRDGRIVDVAPGRSQLPAAVDLEGDILMPGLIELHTDNMEKHFTPRPGVKWPAVPAVMAHDTQVAAGGITTVFDSLSLGDVRGDTERVQNRARMVEAICETSDRRMTLRWQVYIWVRIRSGDQSGLKNGPWWWPASSILSSSV